LIRTSALGDIVHTLPVLTSLRRHFPEARIGWVVERSLAPLLTDHPDLDEVIEAQLRPWRHRPFAARTRREIFALLGALRHFQPEVVLDLMGTHKGAALARLSGSRRRLGFSRGHRREPSSALWINEPARPSGVHAVERALSLLTPLGISGETPDFGGDKLLQETPAEVEEWLLAHPEPYLLLHPGAGWKNKEYPASWWGRVALQAQELTSLSTWISAGPGEEEIAGEVQEASGGAARLAPALGIAGLAAVTRQARLFLGGDTGPLHLAHALGTPVLALMGPTDPRTHGPYASPESVLHVTLPCSFCHKRLPESKACLLALAPERVAQAVARRIHGS
jgi:lipopolysaccharide heptosyltransferase I